MNKRLKTEAQQRVAIGARIRERRLLSEMSLDTLAEKADVSLAQLAKYETGQHSVDLFTMVEIARHLDVDPGYFLTDFTNGHAQPALTTEAIHVAHAMNRLDDRAREFCRMLISAVVKHENGRAP